MEAQAVKPAYTVQFQDGTENRILEQAQRASGKRTETEAKLNAGYTTA